MAEHAPEAMVFETEADALDLEIEDLKAQVTRLKAQRAVHTSNILTSRSSQAILSRLRSSTTPPQREETIKAASKAVQADEATTTTSSDPSDLTDENPLVQDLLTVSAKQLVHNQECLYRTCAGITTFKVQDPDPNAVDNGRVLGIRIEAFGNGRYVRPYYIFLNKPYPDKTLLRVHRHTVPPCIPLAALAARFLPAPVTSGDIVKAKKQDLLKFARTLRREIAHYHNRLRCIASMRKDLGLDDRVRKGKRRDVGIVDISATDAEAMQVRLEWDDGRVGRVVFSESGKVLKTVIIGVQGRDRELERRILSGDGRLETLAERIIGDT